MTQTSESNLQQQLDAQKAQAQAHMPADFYDGINSDTNALVQSGLAEQSLKAGVQAPDFTLPDAKGTDVTLSTLLQQGLVVLTFYRGSWCPFCNLQLRAYQQILPQIQELGATLVAVSPQTPDNSLTIIEKQELAFPVLSDKGNAVARQYGLVFKISDQLRGLYEQYQLDLTQYNGDDTWELPMPGTFIIDKSGTIQLASVNADFMQRLEPAAILDSLRTLR
ncbi:alkyl hydroperoxide reductase [Ktedonobacteria bacterium brp13]|nr:alkyl hydroperoxide reductase [Ktedonobacteria bacterium brp13]